KEIELALSKKKLLLSIQVFYDQTLAVRDHVDAVLHNVIHHSLADRAGYANGVRGTCVGVDFVDAVPQDDHPHLARHRLLYPSGHRRHVVRAKVVLGRHPVKKQREGGGVVVSAIIGVASAANSTRLDGSHHSASGTSSVVVIGVSEG